MRVGSVIVSKRGRLGNQSGIASCFIYGCVGVIAMVIIGMVIAFFVARKAAKVTVEKFTQTAPIELEEVVISETDYTALESRLTNFVAVARSGEQDATLTLSGDDINALITQNRTLQQIQDKIRVQIEGEEITGQVSLPLNNLIPLEMVKGRFLNGTAGLDVSVEDGVLDIRINRLSVGESVLPDQAIEQLKGKNLAEDLPIDPESRKLLNRVESLTIEDGRLKLQVRGRKTEAKPELEPAPKP